MGRLRELVLWVGAALGLLAIGAGLAVAFGGFGFLIFRSGSMSPEIPTGGIALARTVDAADLRTGDVVSVTAANGERITHRVVSSTLRGDQATLVLKGDANATEDSELYVVTSADRVVGSVPVGGYVIAHALTPPGLVALAGLSLMLIVLTGGARDDDAPRGRRTPPRHRDRAPARRRLVAGGAFVVIAAGSGTTLAHTTGTWARFTDKPTVTTGTFTAATLAAPTGAACVPGGTTGTNSNFVWTAPPTPPPFDSYRVSWTRGTATGTASVPVGTTSWRPAGLTLGTYTVQVRTVDGPWTSPLSASDTITSTSTTRYIC